MLRIWCMSRRLLLLLILLATPLLAETPLSQPTYGRAPGDQYAPVVATNGSEFLVAWFDGRAIPQVIYANRVASDGRVLDGTGIRIPVENGSGNARLIGAFRTGGAYTIVYTQQFFLPDNSSRYVTDVARISDDGRLIDGPRLVLANFYATAAGPTLAVLDEHAALLERDIALPVRGIYGVSLASNGTTFLLATYAYNAPLNTIDFTALDANGHPGASSRLVASGIGDGPVIGSDGVDYLVLSVDARLPNALTQVVRANAALGAAGVLPSTSISPLSAALTWTGDKYLLSGVILDQQQSMAVATLARDGAVIGAPHPLGAGTP